MCKPTKEQEQKATNFCRYMHFYCAADGLGRCPICGQCLCDTMRQSEGKA